MGLIDLGSLFHPPGYPGVLPFFWREQQLLPNYLIVIFKTVESAPTGKMPPKKSKKPINGDEDIQVASNISEIMILNTEDMTSVLTCFERE